MVVLASDCGCGGRQGRTAYFYKIELENDMGVTIEINGPLFLRKVQVHHMYFY
jgi:hypothetical protein